MVQRKEEIMQAAEILFAEKGYHETSIVDLCQASGVAEGTVFYHFRSKEGLFVHVLERIVHEIIRSMGEFFETNESSNGLQQLESVIAYYLGLSGNLGARYRLLHRFDIYELARVNSRCRQLLEELYTFLLDMFERPLVRGVEDGSVRSLSATKTSFILFSLVDGMTRLQTYDLYEVGPLYHDVLTACRYMVQNND